MKMFAITILISLCVVKHAQAQQYKLIWSDEFSYTGLPDSTKWSYDVGGNGWGNNELEFYTKADTNNAVVRNGNLYITARKQQTTTPTATTRLARPYTSARLVTKMKGDWLYGRIEVRAILPIGRGLWPAIWMLPTDWKYGGWPASGEIDIMENVGFMPDSIFGSIHTKSFNHVIHTQKTKGLFFRDLGTAFHVYAVEWDARQIRFLVDGNIYMKFDNTGNGFAEWPFDQRFHLLLNVAVGGGWGGQKGIDEAVFPHSMIVDYVRVYKAAN
jgi:beta-glucanase (GH16 family)